LRRGHHEEGRRWLEAALTTRGAAPPADVARGLRAAAVFARVHGDLDASEQLSLESISIARRIGDRGLEMHGIGTRANVALMRSDYSLAAELLVEVEALCRELGDEKSVAVTIGNRAYLAMEMGDSDLALTLAQDALASSRKIGDATNAVVAALNSALAALGLDKRQVARQALVEALEGARALGHRAFLVDGLIIAAAIVADEEPRTATGLLAAGDRGRADLGIELAPIERGVRASVAIQLSGGIDRDDADEIATGDLDAVLDAAAARALESLRPVQNG